jgi:hypothetical protein
MASDLDVATRVGPKSSHGGQHFDQPPASLQRVHPWGFECAYKVHRRGRVKLNHGYEHLRLTDVLLQTPYKNYGTTL